VPEGLPSASRPTPGVRATTLATGTAAFIENRGQFDTRVKFQWKGGGRTLWLTEQGIVFDAIRPQAGDMVTAAREPWRPPFPSSVPSRTSRGYDRLVVLGRNNPSPYTVNGRPLYVHLNGLAIVLLK